VKQVVAEFLAGQNRDQMLIRQLVMIVIWHQAFFHQTALEKAVA
jgi:hypothetical protein